MDQATSFQYYSLQESLMNLELSVDEGTSQQVPANISESKRKQKVKNTTEAVSDRLEPQVTSSDGPSQTGGNRRFFLRPRKRTSLSTKEDAGELVNLYKVENKKLKLDTTSVKVKRTHLETIFEEPVLKRNGSVMLIGPKRVNRSITFSDFITKTRQKKRRAQIKKHKTKINKLKSFKLSIKDVQSKLDEINCAEFLCST